MMSLCTTEFDDRLSSIKNINWLPWIGVDYPKAEKKILALGLSFAPSKEPFSKDKMYAKSGNPDGFGRDIEANSIKEFKNGNPSGKFNVPRNIMTMLLGRGTLSLNKYREIPYEQISNLWRKMVRTNFIQNYNADASWPEIQRSVGVVNAMCEVLKPTHIVMFAKASTNLLDWDYVKKHKPCVLQTPNPSALLVHEGAAFGRDKKEYQAVLRSWNIYPL